MQGFQVEAWFQGETPKDVRDLVLAAIGPPFTWRRPLDAAPVADRETLDLYGEAVFFGFDRRSEDHVVLGVASRGSGTQVREALHALFERLIASRQPAVAECVLAATTMDVYPWFTHSFHRRSPLTAIVQLDDLGSPRAEGTAALGDEDLWRNVGAQLRFVSTATLHRAAAPDPHEHARRVDATVSERGGGWLFDCGWSRLVANPQ